MKIYETEKEGQLSFLKNLGINPDAALIENTDGIVNGNLLEFKKTISDTNKVLFQCIKYLSKLRITGISVPKNIIIIDLNRHAAYLYNAYDFYEDIHKIYSGPASTSNIGFDSNGILPTIFEYDKTLDMDRLKRVLKENTYIKIRIDENCIVSWAERYYRENPSATKADFLGDDGEFSNEGEIRNPVKFKDFIVPYTGETNEKFKYLMDKLNNRLKKKQLGAFYTPELYAKKAHELLQMAIARVPEGNDYVIIDACAGTGSLEAVLTDDELSHCIISTYEYFEYKVLFERLGDKVRHILPPTEQNIEFSSGLITNADAMSKEFIENEIIKEYVDNPKCTIIMYENPPYHDESSGVSNGIAERSGKTQSYAVQQMKKEIKGVATNELSNQFIWRAFKYYLRNENDSYIVFSPIKYWKQYDLFEGHYEKAFIFNRKHFHATESAISCILWHKGKGIDTEISAEAFDIEKGVLKKECDMKILKVKSPASKLYSQVNFNDSDTINIWCNKNGYEATDKKIRVKSFYNKNIIGYLEADSFQIAPHVRNLTRMCLYNGHGCYLTASNYINILPVWVSKYIPLNNWYDNDVYCTTSDGGTVYAKDKDFLKSCLIYTCLSRYNKCLSFYGSDGKLYKNELCFYKDTIASKELSKLTLDKDEKQLINIWNRIILKSQKTGKLKDCFSYGIYQIEQEVNTFTKDKNNKNIYDYPELNAELNTLKVLLKDYYNSHIRNKMFKYGLIK